MFFYIQDYFHAEIQCFIAANSAFVFQNPDLWQQIDELSELTGLNLHEMNQPMIQPPREEINANYKYVRLSTVD